MEKNQFYNLLTNYTSLSAEETNELISLQSQFPYSQVIHGITARGAQDNKFADKDHQLHVSAIYSTDRSVLKSIMTSLKQSRKLLKVVEVVEPVIKEAAKTQPEIISTPVPKEKQPDINKTVLIDTDVDESFYKEFELDLETLVKRKHQFDEAVSNYEKGLPINPEESKPKKSRVVSDPEDGLLKEIKTTKKKIKPEDPKQKEQIDIINQFIKTQPTITKNKLAAQDVNTPKGDLIEKDLTYGENIVSETLVEILLKQGKKEKAIEVLKKLIWKFPQKKAYFAAQIEDLKK